MAREVILEQSEDLDGTIVQTVRMSDGTEAVRRISTKPVFYTCSICGAKSTEPFPKSAISCFRKECLD